ncbi:MAG: cytochrome o ubiquinol oxidase subunit III [Chlamydiales bacterium]|nr:cytochrome o ubiquinol oxidase subunit III [Chlamydiales bacterium]
MTESLTIQQTKYPDPHQDTFSKTILGFWIYLMSDCILFATLFTTYAVLHDSTFGAPGSHELFSVPTSLAETLILLTSSFTCGFALLAACKNKKGHILFWLSISFLLGLTFITLELTEFKHFIHAGYAWDRSAFLSSFFTLVGTHGLHVSFGLLWMVVMMVQLVVHGLNPTIFRRLVCFSMFWHFLDLVWIFIFTLVYLIGTI